MSIGFQIHSPGPSQADHAHHQLMAYLESLGMHQWVQVHRTDSVHGSCVHYRLSPDIQHSVAPGFDTLGLAQTQHWAGCHDDQDLEREIVCALLLSPIRQCYPSIEEFESSRRIRFNIVRAAQQTSMDFKTHALDRPIEYWQYDDDRGFILRSNKCLIEGLLQATQPARSGRQFAFSCYRATEYVVLLGIAQEVQQHHPELFEQLERQWRARALMSSSFHEAFMREIGSQSSPLPMDWYVPGDRIWFRNPDDASSDVYGFEGSWVLYLGGGRFTNFWDHEHPYDVSTKCLEIYHWRDGVQRDPVGELQMDEDRVQRMMERTRACPEAMQQVLARMRRLRDPQGVYAQGGCMDSTREMTRWVRPGTCDIVLPDA
jgi:hypothetical protein